MFNLTVANYPVAEVLYDADNRCFWINNTSKYGYLDVNFEEVVITNVTNVTTSTNPRRSETKFVSLVRSGNPAKGVHQASAAVAAAGIAGGASLLGNLGSNLTTGIGSKKNRELVREQAELNRLFMADQAQRGRAYGLVATKFGNVMDQEFAKYKASLVADTSKDLAQTSVAMQRNMIGITNANLETTIDPGRMNQQYASPSPTSYKEEDKKTGEDQSNKNQSFVEAGAPIEGVGRDILIGSIGGSTGVQVGPNPGVGAPGAPKSFTLPPHEKMPDAPMPTGPRNPDGKMYKAVQPPSEMDASKQATKDQLPSEAIPKSQVTSGSQEITTTAEVHAPPATKENTVFLGSDGGKNQVSTA